MRLSRNKLPRNCAFALCDLRDLQHCLFSAPVELLPIVAHVVFRGFHCANLEGNIKRAVLVGNETLIQVSVIRPRALEILVGLEILVNLFQQGCWSITGSLLLPLIGATNKSIYHAVRRAGISLEIPTISINVFLFRQFDVTCFNHC